MKRREERERKVQRCLYGRLRLYSLKKRQTTTLAPSLACRLFVPVQSDAGNAEDGFGAKCGLVLARLSRRSRAQRVGRTSAQRSAGELLPITRWLRPVCRGWSGIRAELVGLNFPSLFLFLSFLPSAFIPPSLLPYSLSAAASHSVSTEDRRRAQHCGARDRGKRAAAAG